MPSSSRGRRAGSLLLLQLAALTIAGCPQETQSAPVPEPCSGNDDECGSGDVIEGSAASALSLLQRAASVTARASPQASALGPPFAASSAAKPTNTTALPAKNAWQQIANILQKVVNDYANEFRTPKAATGGTQPLYFNVAAMTYPQLVIVTIVYMYFLGTASKMISEGSEFLRFFSSTAIIVGSVLGPLLGALPDSVLVLFSGLGLHAHARIKTGMGVLAGSTVMLLTLPWCMVNMAGSVPLKEDGIADYRRNQEPAFMLTSGVTFGDSMFTYAKFMLFSSLAYLAIQIPTALVDKTRVPDPLAHQAQAESPVLLGSLLFAVLCFFVFLYISYARRNNGRRLQVIVECIQDRKVSLDTTRYSISDEAAERIMDLQTILRCFFSKYDTDGNGFVTRKEFMMLTMDLGLRVPEAEAYRIFYSGGSAQRARDGQLSFDALCVWAEAYMEYDAKHPPAGDDAPNNGTDGDESPTNGTNGKDSPERPFTSRMLLPTYDIENEDLETLPIDVKDEPRKGQQRSLLFHSCCSIIFGVILVFFFSDPAVTVFTEWGKRLGISSFYVSFVLAPFSSHTPELLAAYGYARAKSPKKITMSLEPLVGTACINNTWCLPILFLMMYFRELPWRFSAETSGILMVQWAMGVLILFSKTQRKIMGFAVFSLYPLCLVLVWILETFGGWD